MKNYLLTNMDVQTRRFARKTPSSIIFWKKVNTDLHRIYKRFKIIKEVMVLPPLDIKASNCQNFKKKTNKARRV